MFLKTPIEKLEKKKDSKKLTELLKDKNWKIRRKAAEALVRIGSPSVEHLIHELDSNERHIRQITARILGKIGDERVVEPLIDALQDEDTNVRKNVAEALGIIGDERAVEPLIAALKDEKDSVRWIVALALGKLGDERAVESLMQDIKEGALQDDGVQHEI